MSAIVGLRDIHLPKAISWWPPAPGWWFVAGLCVFILIALCWIFLLRRRSIPADVVALNLIENLRDQQQRQPTRENLIALSEILRRYAIARFGLSEVANLHDAAWLAFLESKAENLHFCNGVGRLLIEAPYAKSLTKLGDLSVFVLVADWIKQVRRQHV